MVADLVTLTLKVVVTYMVPHTQSCWAVLLAVTCMLLVLPELFTTSTEI